MSEVPLFWGFVPLDAEGSYSASAVLLSSPELSDTQVYEP